MDLDSRGPKTYGPGSQHCLQFWFILLHKRFLSYVLSFAESILIEFFFPKEIDRQGKLSKLIIFLGYMYITKKCTLYNVHPLVLAQRTLYKCKCGVQKIHFKISIFSAEQMLSTESCTAGKFMTFNQIYKATVLGTVCLNNLSSKRSTWSTLIFFDLICGIKE